MTPAPNSHEDLCRNSAQERPRVKALVFLGGGRITGALVAGLRLAGYKSPIIVHDRHPEKLHELKRRYRVIAEPDLNRAIAQAGVLMIAVRPASVFDMFENISPVKPPLLAVSLAAGIPLASLRGELGPRVRWARAMPSPVCRSCRGLTGIVFEKGLPAKDRKAIQKIFALVGEVVEIPEREFDAFTVTYSASHGYHALATLAKAAEHLGLNPKTAFTAAAHALADGIVSLREGDDSLDELIEEAATPGGIAATVMSTMDKSGHAKYVEAALRAGMVKAKKNAPKRHS
jgi:pyrroline-5-carboxylate reductase